MRRSCKEPAKNFMSEIFISIGSAPARWSACIPLAGSTCRVPIQKLEDVTTCCCSFRRRFRRKNLEQPLVRAPKRAPSYEVTLSAYCRNTGDRIQLLSPVTVYE